MVLAKNVEIDSLESVTLTAAKKRRIRRNKLHAARTVIDSAVKNCETPFKNCRTDVNIVNNRSPESDILAGALANDTLTDKTYKNNIKFKLNKDLTDPNMSSKEPINPRDDVLAAREAKKILKQKAKNKVANSPVKDTATEVKSVVNESIPTNSNMQKNSVVFVKDKPLKSQNGSMEKSDLVKTVDEVDRAVVVKNKPVEVSDKSRDQIKADRAAKKTAKLAKKKVDEEGDVQVSKDLTVKDVVETLNDIVNVAKEVQEVTAKVEAIGLETKKKEEPSKSKAELRAERRAKQEAQRAAKQTSQQTAKQTSQQAAKPDPSATVGETKTNAKTLPSVAKDDVTKEKSPKLKSASKAKPKARCGAIWIPRLHYDNSKEAMRLIPMNSTLHPAVVRLGVQLASRVVAGSSARCIALLDALKKVFPSFAGPSGPGQMVSAYSLPARTEAARGLEAALAQSLAYLWRLREPSASQLNAVKFFRTQLKQLPDNISELDAKTRLLQEVDRYIREQIGMAGEAISLRVREKIRAHDHILIYGGSSLIERILREAHDAGVRFSVVQCAPRAAPGARGTLRRLRERGVPCYYADVTALGCVMRRINKVLLSASALLSNERAVCAAGAALAAAAARRRNVPVLVACETHKFSERIQTDAFIHNELGEMNCLIDDSEEDSPLRELLSTNLNMSTLSMAYDITPQKFITAVVTELAILPCTSTPVVLRFTEMKNAKLDYRVNGILGLQ